jgi:signal transduction histidine kinase
MQQQIDHQLARARLAAEVRRGQFSTGVAEVAAAVVATLRRTPRGEAIEWTIAVPQGCTVSLENGDLTELVGNLLENAAKWARRLVRLEAVESAGEVEVTVLDDGPGIPADRLASVGARGVRLDATTPGSGLGLAIVRDLVAAYGGRLKLRNRPEGGLAVTAWLPRGAAAATAVRP